MPRALEPTQRVTNTSYVPPHGEDAKALLRGHTIAVHLAILPAVTGLPTNQHLYILLRRDARTAPIRLLCTRCSALVCEVPSRANMVRMKTCLFGRGDANDNVGASCVVIAAGVWGAPGGPSSEKGRAEACRG